MMVTVHLQAANSQCSSEITVEDCSSFPKEELTTFDYLQIRTVGGRGEDHDFQGLNHRTHRVHIIGSPLVWAIEEVLEKAPNLRIIRVSPKMLSRFPKRTREVCQERNIEIIAGYLSEEVKNDNFISTFYRHRKFFLNLEGEQLRLFKELRKFKITEVRIVQRYYCLREERRVSQRALALMFGEHPTSISRKINGVIYYLDPEYNTGRAPKNVAEVIKERVEQKRKENEGRKRQRRVVWYANRLGVRFLPRYEKRDYAKIYKGLWYAQRDGRLTLLRRDFPLRHRALTLGLGMVDRKYHTQQEVANMMGGMTTRAAASRLQREALRTLGIEG